MAGFLPHPRAFGAALVGLLALGCLTGAVSANTHTSRVCAIHQVRVVINRPTPPLFGTLVHAHAIARVGISVCRVVGTHTPVARAARPARRAGVHPLRRVVHPTTASLFAVHLSVPVTHPLGPPIALGVSLAASPRDGMTELDSYSAMVGAAPHLLMWYRQWNAPLVSGTELKATAQRGITPLITWEPQDPANPTDPAYALSAIAAGGWDSYLTTSARAAAATGVRFLINLAPEMNGAWEPWGPAHNANSPAQYIASYRHIVEIFRAHGATNVGWVWAPNADGNAQRVYASYYPGDGWVDWVGLDGYNVGTTGADGWRTPAQIFGRSYTALVGLTTKPVIIQETASSELGGSKALWIGDLAQIIPADFPAVRALVWFERNKETDWRVESSQTALAAFQKLAANPAWAGPAPAVHPGG
jgi:Glycosyl hydrolase family 26